MNKIDLFGFQYSALRLPRNCAGKAKGESADNALIVSVIGLFYGNLLRETVGTANNIDATRYRQVDCLCG
jgi:hypothetical protein